MQLGWIDSPWAPLLMIFVPAASILSYLCDTRMLCAARRDNTRNLDACHEAGVSNARLPTLVLKGRHNGRCAGSINLLRYIMSQSIIVRYMSKFLGVYSS